MSAASFSFTDVTAPLGVQHQYDNGESAGELAILETIGGGVAVFDFDRDGFDDLYFTSGGRLDNKRVTGAGGALWRSRAAKSFELTSAGLDNSNMYSHAAVSGDLNNDGFSDLLVTGYYSFALFLNQGDGTFLESSVLAGLTEPNWGTSAALGDFDGNGALDIYIAHYVDWSFDKHPPCKSAGLPDVCAPGIFNGLSDVIWMNKNNGQFSRHSTDIGLLPEGKGLGVIAAELTGDNQIDIYVANDTTNNFFYKNVGGRFEELGLASGTAVDDMGTPQGSMGLCVLDYDFDQRPDILVSNYENQAFALYKNDGDANFRHVSSTAGLMALGKSFVAWGSSASDFDLDGDEDVAITNGHVMTGSPPAQYPLFLENSGNGKFEPFSFSSDSYFEHKWRGRGLVAFDFDRDGDLDVSITHVNEPAVLLRNDTPTNGQWWVVELIGTHSNRDGIGAVVIIETSSRKIFRSIVGGGSYLSQPPYYLHWGLPKDESLKEINIAWPSGKRQKLAGLSPNARYQIVEPLD